MDIRLGKRFSGKKLSGGEGQKVLLFRALFKYSNFVVLDEPTSAIDPIVEMDILKAFIDNTRGKTSVIISHRVGICTCADKVVLMKDGHVIEYGTYKGLMENDGSITNYLLRR